MEEAVVVDDVEEVAAEQGSGAAGQVAAGDGDGGGVEDRWGQQAALQARVLLGAQLGGLGLDAGAFGATAVDGVAHAAAQQVGFDLALDEVVLGAGGHGVGTRPRFGQAGEDDHGGVGGEGAHGGDCGCSRGVGQVQVEQDAVDACGGEGGAGLREGGADGQLDVQAGVVEELLHEEGVGGVVLDQEDAVERLVGGGRGYGGCGDGHAAASPVCSAGGRTSGGWGARVKWMRAPPWWSGSTWMVPPWNSTIFLHMARPMPLPE